MTVQCNGVAWSYSIVMMADAERYEWPYHNCHKSWYSGYQDEKGLPGYRRFTFKTEEDMLAFRLRFPIMTNG